MLCAVYWMLSPYWMQRSRAARGFAPGVQDLDDAGAVLESLGLIANPQHLLVAGPLVLRHKGARLDLAAFPSGLGLPAEVVREAAVEDVNAGAVLTVENLTSFHEAAGLLARSGTAQSTLLLYLGGGITTGCAANCWSSCGSGPSRRGSPSASTIGATWIWEAFRDLLEEMLTQGRRVEQESIRPILPA